MLSIQKFLREGGIMPVKVTAIKSQDVRRVPREDRPRALMNQARNGRVSKQAIFQLSKQGKQSESFMDAGIIYG